MTQHNLESQKCWLISYEFCTTPCFRPYVGPCAQEAYAVYVLTLLWLGRVEIGRDAEI